MVSDASDDEQVDQGAGIDMTLPLNTIDIDAAQKLPPAIAIAGAWGYIGRKIFAAARHLQIPTHVFDPAPVPDDVPRNGWETHCDQNEFYRLPASMYHLALHPEHRHDGFTSLLGRSRNESLLILNEKPMATPERPEKCAEICQLVDAAGATVLYDFPELFDAMTTLILDYLRQFRQVRITRMAFQRSKDREAPDNPRNYKRMVPIEYQETVHCLAFALYLLGGIAADVAALFDGGYLAEAAAQPYLPPNPETYPYVVDGACRYHLQMGGATIHGLTDFKSAAPWTKYRIIEGIGDGRPFRIEAEYLEQHKSLRLDGRGVDVDPAACSYQQIIRTGWSWFRDVSHTELMSGHYPNPRFTRVAYQLSSILWASAHRRRPIVGRSFDDILKFDAGFAEASSGFARYR